MTSTRQQWAATRNVVPPSVLGMVVAAGLAATWTVHLAMTMPMTTTAGNWRTAWVGLDFAMLVGFLAVGWLARRRDPRVVPIATITGTLLVFDGWFDVCTAAGDAALSEAVFDAVFELSLALTCLIAARAVVTGRKR